jgi:hypothetical protein
LTSINAAPVKAPAGAVLFPQHANTAPRGLAGVRDTEFLLSEAAEKITFNLSTAVWRYTVRILCRESNSAAGDSIQ